jgi:hypothetical protein
MVLVASTLYVIEIAHEKVNKWLESRIKQIYERIKMVIILRDSHIVSFRSMETYYDNL